MTDEELAHYSAALDEIYRLRRALAYEATVIGAQVMDLSRLPKRRREFMEASLNRMAQAARGDAVGAYAATNDRSLRLASKMVGADECLTRHDWEHRD